MVESESESKKALKKVEGTLQKFIRFVENLDKKKTYESGGSITEENRD